MKLLAYIVFELNKGLDKIFKVNVIISRSTVNRSK